MSGSFSSAQVDLANIANKLDLGYTEQQNMHTFN